MLVAALAQLDNTNAALQAFDLQDAQAIIAATQQAMGKPAFLQIWQEGYSKTIRQALEFTLEPG